MFGDGLSITLNDKLQELQNRAARAITKSPYNASTSKLFSKLGWDDLPTRRKKHKAIMMFKTVHELTPPYLHELFDFQSTEYNLRNLENTLFVPKPGTNCGKRTFSYDGAKLCNELPQSVRAICSPTQLKKNHNWFSI